MHSYQLHLSPELSFPVLGSVPSVLALLGQLSQPHCPPLPCPVGFLSSGSSFLCSGHREPLPAQHVGCVLLWDAEQLPESSLAAWHLHGEMCPPGSTLLAHLASPEQLCSSAWRTEPSGAFLFHLENEQTTPPQSSLP